MRLKKSLSYIAIACVLLMLALPVSTFAKQTFGDHSAALGKAVSRTGVDQAQNLQDIPTFLGTGIRAALGLVATIFFVLMFYGGMRWFTSRGEEESVKAGRDTITAALIGLIIVLSAYSITNLVQTRLIERNQAAGGGFDQAVPGEPGPPGCCIDAIKQNAVSPLQGVPLVGPGGAGAGYIWAARTVDEATCQREQASDDISGARGHAWQWYPQTGPSKNLCSTVLFEACFDTGIYGTVEEAMSCASTHVAKPENQYQEDAAP